MEKEDEKKEENGIKNTQGRKLETGRRGGRKKGKKWKCVVVLGSREKGLLKDFQLS